MQLGKQHLRRMGSEYAFCRRECVDDRSRSPKLQKLKSSLVRATRDAIMGLCHPFCRAQFVFLMTASSSALFMVFAVEAAGRTEAVGVLKFSAK